MKKRIVAIVSSIIILAIMFPGCIGIPKDDYNKVISERDSALAKQQELQTDLQELQDRYNTILIEKDQLASQLLSLEQTSLVVQKNLNETQEQLQETQTNLSTANAEIKELKEKYPPRRFRDVVELESWLDRQEIPPKSVDAILWLEHGLRLQNAALADGYIINVELFSEDDIYYTVWCTAILQDGSFYWWDPDTHDIYYWLDIRHF
jgi:ElaB/YqjD/DUF883 family membrane-anchored ribosome-binding protein